MNKKEWFEEEDFWINYGPVMFDEAHWAEAQGVAQSCVDICHLKKNASILDAGCGPGRISVELSLLGMTVTGVDNIQLYLDMAEESARDEGVKLNLIKADLRTFSQKEKYDAAFNLYTSFGYCDSQEEDLQIIKNICQSLKKDAYFILECTSRETAIRYFTEGEWFERDNKTVLTHFEVVGAWEGLKSQWILIGKDGKKIEHTFIQRLYSAAELRELIKTCGFSQAQVFGGYDLRPYDYNAKTMLIVARK
jgi:SAM-dependent methyltransferase